MSNCTRALVLAAVLLATGQAPAMDAIPATQDALGLQAEWLRDFAQADDPSAAVIEVLRTSRALGRLVPRPTRARFTAQMTELEQARAAGVDDLQELYLQARALRRSIALAHPDLAFDSLLFVKRHPGTFPHMCDQYYGGYARAGGGLYALESLHGETTVREVCGTEMMPGSLLSPDLDYDGERIAFAYARVEPDRAPDFTTDPELTYSIYTVRADGTGLRRLTDGPYDEFDPCWLPGGELVFISTRRGGYCRCGARPVPTYTLHRMAADGSRIRELSPHETNEWHPVVGNDGSLIYTRWDYVDRHTNLAHSLWQARADGSHAMALYGNYNDERRPWGIWHAQPIPDTRMLLAIAGAHHGYAYGSVVRIDPWRGYDGLEPLTRLTPEVPFPEAEGFPNSAYTTPRPLSDQAFLVAYSPDWSTSNAAHTVTQGIYLMLKLPGDGPAPEYVRELVYRDPQISSIDPIPLRPRPHPTAWPVDEAPTDGPSTGRFLVLNAYDSASPLPDDAKIAALRVVQILPKTTIVADQPPVSVAKQVSARYLLGTVPVEPDGSAYFEAPAGVPLYVQTVDEDGVAVQTMRSVTYLQPGESATCVGCHEHRDTAPQAAMPAALTRGPSTITPGPEGSRPFSFPRLVQPVLDRRCVSCHSGAEPDGGITLTGDYSSDSDPYSVAYRALARRDLVHWFDSVNGGEWIPRTAPGAFGARASKLIALLRAGHHGVELAPDELERLCLWIDLNVPFYGAYEPEHVALQRAGGVPPLEQILQ